MAQRVAAAPLRWMANIQYLGIVTVSCMVAKSPETTTLRGNRVITSRGVIARGMPFSRRSRIFVGREGFEDRGHYAPDFAGGERGVFTAEVFGHREDAKRPAIDELIGQVEAPALAGVLVCQCGEVSPCEVSQRQTNCCPLLIPALLWNAG